MKYKKLYNYYGAKNTMVYELKSILPKGHEKYVEPYAGSAAVFLNKDKAAVNILNDYDDDISFFLQMLTDKSKAEQIIAQLKRVKVSEELFDRAMKNKLHGYYGCSDIKRACYVYLMIVLSFNSIRKSYREISQKQYLNEIENGLEKAYESMTGALVFNKDALDIIREHDSMSTFMFIDSPYLVCGKSGRVAEDVYTNDFEISDHIRLLNATKNLEADVVMCGYLDETGLYDSFLLTEGSAWKRYLLKQTVKSSSCGESKPIAREYVWINYDLPDTASAVIDMSTEMSFDRLFDEEEI